MADLALHVEGAEDAAFRVLRFSVRERLNEPFSVAIVAGSTRSDLDPEDLILQPASFSFAAGWAFVHGGGRRTLTGVCFAAEQLSAEPAGLSLYAIRVVPRLALLGLRRDARIFQHARVPEILAQILEGFAVPAAWHLDAEAFPVLDYKVQYGETDLAFFTRLCEEAGITFAVRDGDDDRASVVVLNDAPGEAPPREGSPLPFLDAPMGAAEREHVTRVRLAREARPVAMALRDFDFRNPALALDWRVVDASDAPPLLEHFHFDPGAFRAVSSVPSFTPIADLRGAARHDLHTGARRAEHLLAGERGTAASVAFETNALDLAPGVVFSIGGHPQPRLADDRRLLVTELGIDGERDKEWTARGKAFLADRPYRPARRTPRPIVHGLQSAIVTGPEGEELFTDEHGRVRVRFLWDRSGATDDLSSCWIRVSQGWAGAGFGLWTLPRVGQEVLIQFLEGNPDEPIVVGRAPNALNPPPYPLPANATKAVWRSRSTPDADGFNEISFEDRAGRERFFERAERDKETLVRADELVTVGGRRRHRVEGDADLAIGGSKRERIGGTLHTTIDGEHRERIGGAQSAIVGGDRQEQIGGRWSVDADGTIHLSSGTAIVIEAPDVTIKGAGGFIRVGAGGVTTAGGWSEIHPGAPGSGDGSAPAVPELPGGGAGEPSLRRVRLPLFGFGGLPPMAAGVDPEKLVICEAMCSCKDVRNGTNGTGPNRQNCVTTRLWNLDDAMKNQSTIKAEAPYDMSRRPPAPIMSRNNPARTTRSRPAGSRIPDVVLVNDGSKPPTRDNIKKIIEIKFPGDPVDDNQMRAYERIAGKGKTVELWTLDSCGCQEKEEPQPVPVPVPKPGPVAVPQLPPFPPVAPAPKPKPVPPPAPPPIPPLPAPGVPGPSSPPSSSTEEKIAAVLLALLILGLILDDAVGGEADDVAIPELVEQMMKELGPAF
jgi:type VI secretion system secreted protein VgrG